MKPTFEQFTRQYRSLFRFCPPPTVTRDMYEDATVMDCDYVNQQVAECFSFNDPDKPFQLRECAVQMPLTQEQS